MVLPSLTLCYHACDPAWDDALSVEPRRLVAQVRMLMRGRRPASIVDAARGHRGALHVTFDDAYVSIWLVAPALCDLGVRATVFACSAYGDGRPLDVPELNGQRYDARGLRTLTWDDLRSLAAAGFEIGSHTSTHPHLPTLETPDLRKELSESRECIEDEIGRPCRALAYPYGAVDDRVRAAAREAGYDFAFGLPGRPGDAFDLPRMGIYRRDRQGRVLLKSSATVRRVAARRGRSE